MKGSMRIPGLLVLVFCAFVAELSATPDSNWVKVPSAFHAGKKELKVKGAGVEKVRMKVYDQYGELAFVTDNGMKRGWGGTMDGEPAKADVYYVNLKGRFEGGDTFQRTFKVQLKR